MADSNEVFKETAIILPSLNPDKKFTGVVNGLVEKGFEHIVIVDDGSDSEHQRFFDEAEKQIGRAHV